MFFKSQLAFDADLAIAKLRCLSDQKGALEQLDALPPSNITKKTLADIEQRSMLWKAGAR